MAKDSVCGMDLDEKNAAATAEYKGKAFYCNACKAKFDKAPEQYPTS